MFTLPNHTILSIYQRYWYQKWYDTHSSNDIIDQFNSGILSSHFAVAGWAGEGSCERLPHHSDLDVGWDGLGRVWLLDGLDCDRLCCLGHFHVTGLFDCLTMSMSFESFACFDFAASQLVFQLVVVVVVVASHMAGADRFRLFVKDSSEHSALNCWHAGWVSHQQKFFGSDAFLHHLLQRWSAVGSLNSVNS